MESVDRALTTAKWRSRILKWSDTWPRAGVILPSGRKRDRFLLLRAVIALADRAMADGSLRRRGGTPWSLEQLADAMGVTPKTARDVMQWLSKNDWLAMGARGSWTGEGRTADARCLVLPIREFASSSVPEGPSGNIPAAIGEEPPSHQGINGTPSGSVEIDHSPNSSSSSFSLSSLDPKEIFERARAKRQREMAS